MKRILSAAITSLAVIAAAVTGVSTIAGAHHVDCEAQPTHRHCQTEVDVPADPVADPAACDGPAAGRNPHCGVLPGLDATTTTTGSAATTTSTTSRVGESGATAPPAADPVVNSAAPSGDEGASDAEVLGETVVQDDEPASDGQARPGDRGPSSEPAPAADASEGEPRFTG